MRKAIAAAGVCAAMTLGIGAAAGIKPAPMEAMTTKELVKRYQDCWGYYNEAQWDKFAGCYASNAVSHYVDSGQPDMTGPKDILDKGSKVFKTAMPDSKGALQLVLASGKSVFSIALMTGTHTGPLASPAGAIPPTKKKIGLLVLHGVTFTDDGKVTEEWFIQDMGTMLGQLGLSPASSRPVLTKGWPGAPIIALAADNDAEKANLATAQKEIDAFNTRDFAGALATATRDVVLSSQAEPADVKGKKDLEAGLKHFTTAFSDAKLTPSRTLAAGNYVLVIGKFTGTNDGDMTAMNLKKTGKKVDLSYAEITEFTGGKIKAYTRFYNGMAFAEQLGLLASPSK